jgi:hypothetical protein
MKEKRKNIRYLSSAQIRVAGNEDFVLFLKDISITGCSITNVLTDTHAETGPESAANNAGSGQGGSDSQAALAASSIFTLQNKVADLAANREYTIEIYPETDAGVEPFELAIELSWIRSENGVYEAGGFISGYPKGKRYQQFANNLAWRAASL